ncbi:MAG: hypothetical protein J3Q66DRAFT_186235, partial [Benniella sp.]
LFCPSSSSSSSPPYTSLSICSTILSSAECSFVFKCRFRISAMKFHLVTLVLTLLIGAQNTVNAVIPKPPIKSLSALKIREGTIVALRNNWPTARAKGRGYLSLCNECMPGIPHVATHSGDSKGNPWSQFEINIVQKEDSQNYPVITLKNIWGQDYLAACGHFASSCPSNIKVGLFSTTLNSFAWWKAFVVERGGKNYLALENSLYSRATAKLCETCFSSGRDELTVSEDNEEKWGTHHLYSVEIVYQPK